MYRGLLPTAVLALSVLLSAAARAGEHGEADPVFERRELLPGLHLLQTGRGGNIAVSQGDDGLLIIDDEVAEVSEQLSAILDKLGGEQALKYILNTHWHGDHSGGNLALGPHATIVAHDSVRERLSTRQVVRHFDMVKEPYPAHALPSVTYQTQMSLHFNGDELRLIHYPHSHTDGDTAVFFRKANVVHAGDLFFNPMFPFVDVENGGNTVNMIASVRDILSRIDPDTVVIPGHGSVTDAAGLRAYLTMLEGTTEEILAMKTAGLDLAAAREQGLSPKWDTWGEGFIDEPTWIGFVYRSLDKK